MFKKIKNFLTMPVSLPNWGVLVMAFFYGYGLESFLEDIWDEISYRRHRG